MSDFKIEMKIKITDESGKVKSQTVDLQSFMTEEEACSIDKVEKAVLSLNKEAIRQAVAKHLEAMSKKKQKMNNLQEEESSKKILPNTKLTEK